MSQPTPYSKTYGFQADETNGVAGRSTVKTAQLDTELSNIETTLGDVLSVISLNQRDDGEIRDGRVKPHTLSSDTLLLLSSDLNPRGDWVTATAYAVGDLVTQSSTPYICLTAHTSGTFATDLAAAKWMAVVAAVNVANYVGTLGTTPTIAPVASGTDCMAIGNASAATGTDAIAIGRSRSSGTASFAAVITDKTTSYGALANGAIAIGELCKASTANSVAIGAENTASINTNTTVIGGFQNTSGGQFAIVAGGQTCTTEGMWSAVLGGQNNACSASGAVIVGGATNVIDAGATNAAVVGGSANTIEATGTYSAVVAGAGHTVKRPYTLHFGKRIVPGVSGGGSLHVARAGTTDATPTTLTQDGTNSCLIRTNSTVAFRLNICGRRTDVAGEAAAYEIKGLIANNAGTTALIGAITKTVIAESDATWDATATANNATDALDITVTGAAGKTISWSAICEFNEIY